MRRSGSSKPRVHVVWDEQNLDYLEANKTPKQKITEPKTPYHAPEAEDGVLSPKPDDDSTLMADAEHAEAIRHALSEVASTSNADEAGCSRAEGSGWSSSEDEAEVMDHDMEGFESNGRRRSFEERRRAHYDEYRKAKALLKGQEMSDEDEKQTDGGQKSVDVASSSDRLKHEYSCASGSSHDEIL
ncbi:hypothetical protein R1flu_012509 [Riccia fluitans]|uniref:Protein phosphatase inhibitor 2 n=1 Tax=Riccia fluitans TaxID=41844 RepID=A0ABD1ZAU2_9MARC